VPAQVSVERESPLSSHHLSLTTPRLRYSLFFASRGASVVVNDLSPEACQRVVQEIQQAGGKAAAAPGSVTEGEKIVEQAVKAFGTVHILINNAGVLREFRALVRSNGRADVDVGNR
jgi:NAD(P)-dependent dehydrogenase (short-subunit alcohol dehydrogenase family)